MSENKNVTIDLDQAKLQASDSLLYGTAIVVDNRDVWREAREKRAGLKKLYSAIQKHFKLMKQPWDEGKKKILDEEKKYAVPMEEAIDYLDKKILSFEDHLLTEREEFRHSLQEKERQRAMDAQLAEASEAERDGDKARALEILNRTIFVPQIVLPDIEKEFIEGEGRNETWSVDPEEYDIKKIAQAVLDGSLAENYLLPNFTAANATAKALKETFNLPGFTLRKRRGITQR